MAGLVHSSTVRFAIIQVSANKDHPESLVVAYPDENCLHDLIAAPSIVRVGFTSREEAMAKLVSSMPNPRAFKEERRSICMSYKAQQDGEAASGCGLLKNRRISCHFLQSILATITVFFYSNNLFSAMLRAALGLSS